MPGVDGVEVCRRLRSAGDRTPVLMLTARDADRRPRRRPGRRRGRLPGQAVRAEASSRRGCGRCCGGPSRDGAGVCASPTSSSTPSRARCAAGARRIELSRTEFSLLELFLAHPRQVLTRSEIFERVWGYDFGVDLQRARRLRRLPAPQDRGGRGAAPAPHRARRRLRPARGVVLTLRRRLALASAAIVGATVVAAAGALLPRRPRRPARAGRRRADGAGAAAATGSGRALRAAAAALRRRVRRLRARAPRASAPDALPGPSGPARRARPTTSRVVDADGRVLALAGDALIAPTPSRPAGRRRRGRARGWPTATSTGVHLRVLTVPVRAPGAILLGRSLEGVDRTLARLRLAARAALPRRHRARRRARPPRRRPLHRRAAAARDRTGGAAPARRRRVARAAHAGDRAAHERRGAARRRRPRARAAPRAARPTSSTRPRSSPRSSAT